MNGTGHSEHDVESADELLTTLRNIRYDHSLRYGPNSLAFRGQARDWTLVPSAFRNLPQTDVRATPAYFRDLCLAEFRSLKSFISMADEIGIDVPGDGHIVRDSRQLEHAIATCSTIPETVQAWPPDEILNGLAIAQHSGIKTRLLDFSYDPNVAAYFAAAGALEKGQSQSSDVTSSERFIVWVLGLSAIRHRWSQGRSDCRLREVIVPSAKNSYLRAQRGLFLMDVDAHYYIAESTTYSGLEDIYKQLEDNPSNSESDSGEISYFSLKVSAPFGCARETIQRLSVDGYSRYKLFPSLKSAAECVAMDT